LNSVSETGILRAFARTVEMGRDVASSMDDETAERLEPEFDRLAKEGERLLVPEEENGEVEQDA
jgi:O-methyltransferase involved in polyketide biosynthesis